MARLLKGDLADISSGGVFMRLFMPMAFVIALGTLAVALVTVWLGYTFHQFEDFDGAGDMACTPVVGISGAADLEAFPEENIVFMSSYDERADAERGQIIRFDLDNPLDDTSWRDRTGGRPLLFRPGGIDLYQERLPSGLLLRRLFVVNHEGPEVLIFNILNDGRLELVERFGDERLTSPNDVVATGPKSFYVSNDTASGRQSVRGKADFLFGIPTGEILHFDGTDWEVSVEGLKFPNGLALSDEGDVLYVAEMRAEAIRMFDRDPTTKILEGNQRVALGSFPNNLSVDAEGRLLVGAIPQPFAYEAFSENLREVAPSQVLRVNGGSKEVLYQDGGRELSAATVAAPVGNKTLVGTGGDDRFLICEGA